MLNIFLLRDVFKRSKCCLDPWLSCLFDHIHIYIFPFFEKLFLSNLDNSLTPLDTQLIYRALQLLFIAILTPLDSQVDRSRKFLSPRQLLDPSSFLLPWTPARQLHQSTLFKARHLSTPLDLSRIIELVEIGLARFGSHFPRSLSIALNRFTSQTHFSFSKLHSQEIFGLYQVSLHLVSV